MAQGVGGHYSSVGIFDGEAKKMAAEAAAEIRSSVRREGELNEVARNMSEDLASYIVNHPRREDVDVGVHDNCVILRGRSSGRTLEIACEGPDTFGVQESMGFQRQVTEPRSGSSNARGVDQGGMARRVLKWLNELQAA